MNDLDVAYARLTLVLISVEAVSIDALVQWPWSLPVSSDWAWAPGVGLLAVVGVVLLAFHDPRSPRFLFALLALLALVILTAHISGVI